MKTKTISLKISESENIILEKKARSAGLNKSEYLRRVAIHSAVHIKVVDKKYQQKLLFLLSNATNNINQIAKKVNIKSSTDMSTLKELQKISNYFKSIVGKEL